MRNSSRKAAGVARGLGWFSIGLGVAQLLAPRALSQMTGMRGQHGLMRLCGAREFVNGVGLLAARNPTPWVWARVAGDALDLVAIAAGAQFHGRHRTRALVALSAVAAVSAVDVVAAARLAAQPDEIERTFDYSRRSGFPRPVEEMRGAAADFRPPRDMRTPAMLRPLATPARRAGNSETATERVSQ
jgi:hypothetical protein